MRTTPLSASGNRRIRLFGITVGRKQAVEMERTPLPVGEKAAFHVGTTTPFSMGGKPKAHDTL